MTPLTGEERCLVGLPSTLSEVVAAEPIVRRLYERLGGDRTPDRLSIAGSRHLLDAYTGLFPSAGRIPHTHSGGERASDWKGHDVALLLGKSRKSAWCAMRARIPRRVGWSGGGRAFFLTESLAPALERGHVPSGVGTAGSFPRKLPRPFSSSCAELAAMVGLMVDDDAPRLAVDRHAFDAVSARLEALGVSIEEPFLVLNAGGRPESAAAWPARSWVRLLDSLAARFDLPALLVCGPREEAPLGDVLERSRHPRLVPLFEPALDLLELTAVCSRALAVVTPDNGARHVASAVGAPVVVLCGPTDPRLSGNRRDRTEVLRVEVPCGPCHLETCPLSGADHHACMRLIDPERVLSALRPALEGEDPQSDPHAGPSGGYR